MTNATTEFFEELGRRGHEPLLKKANGTVRFDLEQGSRTEYRLVAVKKGDIVVSQENVEADCVFRTERELFDLLVGGKSWGRVDAFGRGRVDVEKKARRRARLEASSPGTSKRRRRASRPGQERSTG
jgi:hypothetical protein